MSVDKTLEKLLRGESDANIRFDEICQLLEAKGFRMRVSGSHHIFTKSGVMERINLQRGEPASRPYNDAPSQLPRAPIRSWKLEVGSSTFSVRRSDHYLTHRLVPT